MKKYEAMFIVKPDLSESDRKTLFSQISESIIKNNGSVTETSIWSEKKKLCFPIKKIQEGTYYLVNFTSAGDAIAKLKLVYKLNESIMRVLITKQDNKKIK